MIQDLCEIPFSPLQMLLCSHSSSAVTLQIANLCVAAEMTRSLKKVCQPECYLRTDRSLQPQTTAR